MRDIALSTGPDAKAKAVAWLLLMGILFPPSAFAERTRLKPGMNFFSPQQDVELGRQVAQDAETKLAMLNNKRIDDYLDRLGKKLAARAPGEKYPYQFKCVNDSSINAFALPGGFLYVNRGTFEAADNEAELAGVIGHEIGHVALRHGTNQASKAYLAQAPLSILGGLLGSDSIGAILAQVGTSFAVNSVLLKYSRDAERQADLIGAQILFDSDYDPRYLAQFFEKLDTKGRGSDFFSSHPNPENRIQNINSEIAKIGTHRGNFVNDTNEFHELQKELKSLPPPPKDSTGQTKSPTGSSGGRPSPPSSRLQRYDAGNLALQYPDNWKVYGKEQAFTLAPEGGIADHSGNPALVYGVMTAVFSPSTSQQSGLSLSEATDQLIASLQRSNSGMRVIQNQGQLQVGGERAISTMLANNSPLGGGEADWLVTVSRPEGLVYFVFVTPEQDFAAYQQTFRSILNSVRFSNR